MPGPEPRYWGPFAALVWIVTRDDELTSAAAELERTSRAPIVNVPSFLAMRNRELDVAGWLELDGPSGDPGTQLALWRFVDPSMKGPAKDIETALPALLRELQDGSRLQASGHKNLGDERAEIPVHFWSKATAYLPDPSGDVHIAFADERTVWTDILLGMHHVKRCWQPLSRGDRMARRPTETSIAEWYRERVANWPAGKAPPSVNDDWTDAKHQMSLQPSRDQIAVARRQLAPPEWKQRGRRPVQKTPEL